MSEEKKIFVDEDWKSQVEAEKQQAQQQPQSEPAAPPLPPANFLTLVSTFATEAMVGLGQIPAPGQTEPRVHLEHAKYVIDTLDMLEAKTQGNLDEHEAEALKNLLHQLKLAFVAIRSAPPEEPGEGESPGIVTP